MLRVFLYVVLLALLARAMMRLWRGLVEGATGHAPQRAAANQGAGVRMVRDPVCGTFVLPGSAVALAVGREWQYFCSAACRDAFQTRGASGPATPRSTVV